MKDFRRRYWKVAGNLGSTFAFALLHGKIIRILIEDRSKVLVVSIVGECPLQLWGEGEPGGGHSTFFSRVCAARVSKSRV